MDQQSLVVGEMRNSGETGSVEEATEGWSVWLVIAENMKSASYSL